MKDKLRESDLVVGNLETVFAGEEAGYTNDVYSFNTPDRFVCSMKSAGIDYVSTANNHCLDRGTEGLIRTLDLLDQYGIKHFGTYRSKEERTSYELLELGGKKIALIAYTYGTNVVENGIVFKEDEEFYVNVLKSQEREWLKFKKTLNTPGIRSKLSRYIRKVTTLEQRMRIKKKLGMLKNLPKSDDLLEDDIYPRYLERLKSDIEKARCEADYVIVCLHSGGLFNVKVGAYTEYIVDLIVRAGADAIVGNHPHVVQKFVDKGCLVAYSLGNFSISPSSLYLVRENLPEYSVLLHFYFDKERMSLYKVTFSILKIVESKNGNLSVYPINALYDKCDITSERDMLISDCTKIYNTFTGKKEMAIDILDEYVCFEKLRMHYESLFFAHCSITNSDGATLSMYNIIDEMLRRGIEVVVVLANTRNLEGRIAEGKIKFIVAPLYGMRMDLNKKTPMTQVKFFVKSICNSIQKRKIEKVLKSENIDIIHINGLDSSIGAEIAQKLKIPYVWHIRQFMEADLGKKLFREKYVYRLVARASSVIAISKDVQAKFEPLLGRKMDLVYNGVPVEKYKLEDVTRFESPVTRMLLAGRISVQKGQMDAIKAVELLMQRGIDTVLLTLVGQGETKEYLEYVKSYVKEHELEQKFAF